MNIPPPAPRTYRKRAKADWEALAVDDSLLVTEAVAAALRGWLGRRGRKSVQRAEGKLVRVWRIS